MGKIYKITNNTNGKIYIGKTVMSLSYRWKRHLLCVKKRINRHLYDAINRYGENNFSIELIEECPNDSCNERERFWIACYRSNNRLVGYNMTEGGDGGNLGVDAINKMAAKKRGRKLSEEHKRKISEGNKGISKPLSNETREKISRTLKMKGCKPPITHRYGVDHPMYNKHHSVESKKKMSIARRGKSYEDIFDDKTVTVLKDLHKERWSERGNPNYVEFNVDEHLEEILNAIRLKELACKYNIAYPTLLDKFKRRYNQTITEYRNENNLVR